MNGEEKRDIMFQFNTYLDVIKLPKIDRDVIGKGIGLAVKDLYHQPYNRVWDHISNYIIDIMDGKNSTIRTKEGKLYSQTTIRKHIVNKFYGRDTVRRRNFVTKYQTVAEYDENEEYIGRISITVVTPEDVVIANEIDWDDIKHKYCIICGAPILLGNICVDHRTTTRLGAKNRSKMKNIKPGIAYYCNRCGKKKEEDHFRHCEECRTVGQIKKIKKRKINWRCKQSDLRLSYKQMIWITKQTMKGIVWDEKKMISMVSRYMAISKDKK
jgi:ribosomal protein L37E